jgi:HPt (histidine-containing phosphotransfer) domain-containing protein
MSAGVLESERQRCLDSGMNGFVAKPMDLDSAVRLILESSGIRFTCEDPDDSDGAKTPALQARDWILPSWSVEGVDLAFALARLRGDEAALKRLLRQFVAEHRRDLEAIDRAVAANQSSQVVALLHGLRGVAGNFGAHRLVDACRAAEQSQSSGSSTIPLPLLAEVRAAFEQIAAGVLTVAPPGPQVRVTSPGTAEPGFALLRRLLAERNFQATTEFELALPELERVYGTTVVAAAQLSVDKLDFDGALALLPDKTEDFP